jgi:Na+-driven multidrug efflux pump
MRIVAISIAINAGLDPLLIFGLGPFPELGVAGAAWATVISQLGAVVAYATLLGRRRADARGMWWTRPALSRALGKRILLRGVPAGVQFLLISVVLGLILVAVKPHGAVWTAVAGGGFRIMQQTFLPMVALGSAAGAIAGQNLGAGQPLRVRQAALVALRWAVVYGAVMAALLMVGGRVAGLLFARGQAELDLAVEYFRWSAPTVFAFALAYIPTFVLQASGRALLPLSAALVRLAALAVGLFVVIPACGLDPLWVFGLQSAAALLEGVLGVGLLAWFLRRLSRQPPAAIAPAAGR